MISYEEYNGSWYYYAKATNEVGTRYVSTPNIIIDADPAVALEYPSGKELTGKYGKPRAVHTGAICNSPWLMNRSSP